MRTASRRTIETLRQNRAEQCTRGWVVEENRNEVDMRSGFTGAHEHTRVFILATSESADESPPMSITPTMRSTSVGKSSFLELALVDTDLPCVRGRSPPYVTRPTIPLRGTIY